MVWDRVRQWVRDSGGISSLSTKAFGVLQGRHTAFALFFAGSGLYLALHGKLTDQYVNLVTALQAYVLVHSAKEAVEDYSRRKDKEC
jgi:hypothetical protein